MLQIRYFCVLLLLGAIGTVTVASAQCDATITGTVVGADGGVLPGAAVWVPALRVGTAVGPDGTFSLSNLCDGSLRIAISFVGYKNAMVTVTVPQVSPLVITLNPDTRVLHEVIVEGAHAQQHNISQAVSVLNEADLEATKGRPLGEMLQRLPGVNAIMLGPAIFKPVIHGLHSQRIVVLNNGVKQEGQQWGMEHAPELDTYAAAEVEVVKGAETVRYGAEALGGVVIINAASLFEDTTQRGELNLHAATNSRALSFSGMLQGGLAKSGEWRWRLQASVKKGGDFHAPDYNLSNTGAYEGNGSAEIAYRGQTKTLDIYASSFNTTVGILRSAHTGNLNDLQSSIENQRPWYVSDFSYNIANPRQKVNHQLLRIKGSADIAGVGRVHVQYGAQYNQRKEFDIRRGGRSNKAALSMRLFSQALDASVDHTLGIFSGSIGLSGAYRINKNVPGTGVKPLLPDYDLATAGVFAFEKLRRGPWLLEAGARFEHQYLQVATFTAKDELIKPVFRFRYAAASLAASYFFSERVRLSSNAGLSARPPHVSETYSEGLHHGTGSIEEGLMLQDGAWRTDPAFIKNEISKKWITTLQAGGRRWSMEVSGYVNAMDNYIYLQPQETRLTIRGYFPVFQYQTTDAVLSGADISVDWHLSKYLRYTGKASYLYAKDVTENDVLPMMPPAQFENALTFTKSALGPLQQVYVTMRVPTTLKQQRAPVAVYPADVPAYMGDKNFDFMAAPAAYTLLHAEAGTTLDVNGHDLLLIFSGENLLNASYRNYMNRLRYYADDLGRNFTLRAKYAF